MKNKGISVGRALCTLYAINNTPINEIYTTLKKQFHQSNESLVIDVIESIYALLDTNVDLTQFLPLISQKISWNSGPCVKETMIIALDVIKNRNIKPDNDFITDILIGLNKMLDSDEEVEINNESFLNHLELKVSATRLAANLYDKYTHYNLDIPITLIRWKDACTSSDEFEEIRNAWISKID